MNRATKKSRWRDLFLCCQESQTAKQNSKGQALVEFTLVFLLLLVVALIPADFGLAFFSGQVALNASRGGARIAAADPNVKSMPGIVSDGFIECVMPSCGGNILGETAARLQYALLPGAKITLTYIGDPAPAATEDCNDKVRVEVDGTYNYWFLGLLGYFGVSPDVDVNIIRSTEMRYEHQC